MVKLHICTSSSAMFGEGVCAYARAHLVVRLVATGQLFSSGCFATTRGRAGVGNIMAPVTAATGKFIDVAAGAGHTLAVTTAGASPVRGWVCGAATLMPSLLTPVTPHCAVRAHTRYAHDVGSQRRSAAGCQAVWGCKGRGERTRRCCWGATQVRRHWRRALPQLATSAAPPSTLICFDDATCSLLCCTAWYVEHTRVDLRDHPQ